MTGLHGTRKGRSNDSKSVFGNYSDAEMVSQLRRLALDPCSSKFSKTNIQPLWDQAIRARKAMALAHVEFPLRKRKLQQLLNALPGFGSRLSNLQNGTKLSKGQVSHVSSKLCLPIYVESDENFGRKIVLETNSSNSLLTFEDNSLDEQIYQEPINYVGEAINLSIPCKHANPLVNSDESVNCSSENFTSEEEVPSLNLDDHYSNSPILNSPNKKRRRPHGPSNRILNFIGVRLRRMVVPVGPRFQADVPDWTGSEKGEDSDSDSSRWLGTTIWPIEGGGMRIATKAVARGRPESCSCLYPASVECIRRHIIEERLLLLCDLGNAFFRMKLDETGEQISKSWTLDEQHKFDLLAKTKPPSDGNDFLEHALKCFPYKGRKAIMSYYFNVFIPRQMRSSKQVDTGDEEVDNFNCLDLQQEFEGRTGIGSSKSVKARFLRGPS